MAKVSEKIVRDLPFAKRLEIACEGNPHCPTDQYRGKQKWIYDNLRERFGITVSPEAVRRWFAGEMRPRRKTIAALAQLLEVDLGWLTLGTVPDMQPKERKARNAVADGAVNLVAGIIQMNGGHVAFPESKKESVDLFAIIEGIQHSIDVRLEHELEDNRMRFTVKKDSGDTVVIGVVRMASGFGVRLLRLDPDAGELRGDFREIVVEQRGPSFFTGKDRIPEIVDILQISGTTKVISRGRVSASVS